MGISIEAKGIDSIDMQLAMACMPAKKRKRFMIRIGNEIRTKSRANARKQESPEGEKWAPRKSKKGGKKMFKKLPQTIAVDGQPNYVNVYFSRRYKGKSKFHSGVIAKMHDEGRTIKRDKARHKMAMQSYQERNGIDQKSPATDAQAKFIVKMKATRFYSLKEQKEGNLEKGKTLRITKKWVLENLTFAKAGAMISSLQGKKTSGSGSWQIKLPHREFLGATPVDQKKIFERVLQGINYGWTVKKQDMRG